MRRSFLFLSSLCLAISLLSGCSSGNSSGSGGGSQPVSNPTPSVVSINPASVPAGSGVQTLVITGSGFVKTSVVSFNGVAVPTTYSSSTSLQAGVPASALTAGGVAPITVTNPSPAGGISAPTSFSIISPTPQVSSFSPGAVAQAHAVTVTITGSGFESNSTVSWNGSAKPTTFVNSTTLQVSLTAADVQDFGSAQVTVTNPGPGGSTTPSAAVVVYPVPHVTAVAPASLQAGSTAQQIVVTGTNFVSGSVVLLDGAPLATTNSGATSLTAQVPANALTNGRTATLAVQNPDPLPATSSSIDFPITSPTPALTSLSPSSVIQGQAAIITVTGSGFEANSAVQWNGSPRTTTFVNATSLKGALTAIDLATAGTGQIAVNNPGPGGSTSASVALTILAPPVISSVTPSSIQSSTSNTATANVTLSGSNFATNATVSANSQKLTIMSQSSSQIVTTLTSSQLYYAGVVKLVVANPANSMNGIAVSSQPATLNIINPTAAFTLSPNSATLGSPDLKVSVYGSGFFADSVLQWNGMPLATTYASASSLTAIIPSTLLSIPGTATVSISTPENNGVATPTQGFSTYLTLPVNDIAWNRTDGLIYATAAGRAGPGLGNSLVGIDPATGVIQRTIFVGSEPNRLAISDDGTQAFVGLDGAGAVRQVNLQTGTAGLQFRLGGGQGIYNFPYTASSIAAVPGQPNSVAVYSTGGFVSIYDSGVARTNSSKGLQTYFSSNYGGLAFGSSASTLYVSSEAVGSYVYALTVDSSGITGSRQLAASGAGRTLQYDNGRLYFPTGIAADASTGNGVGQFSLSTSYSSTTTAAVGPIISDFALNRAWVVPSNYGGPTEVIGYDETTFNPVSTLPVTGVGTVNTNSGLEYPADLIRWGQNGLAFHTPDQLYMVHGSIVKDSSSSPADLKITAQIPAALTTGTAFSYQLQVSNLGSGDAQGVTVTTRLPGALIYGSTTASQGSCSGDGVLYCNLGALKNGAFATVTVTAVPSVPGSIQIDASIDSQSFDPITSNNQVVASTTASGSLYSPVPVVSNLSPNLVSAGAPSFTLTVNGSEFTAASTIKWNGTDLTTTLINSGQLTATVDASLVKQLGWGQVSVSSAAPGGGDSGALTVSIYSLLPIPVNAMTYDPFTRKLWAVLPSTSASIAGNSLVSIDPTSGTVGQPIQVGSEPDLIAETSSGNFFYLGLSGAKSLARFNMATQSLDFTVPLATTGYFAGPAAATSLAPIPGLDNSIAVSNIGIIDFNGSTPTTRPNSALGYNDAVFPDAGHVYTYDNESTGAELYRYTVDSNGVHLIDQSSMQGMGGFSGGLALDGGLLYGFGGGIVDPSTTPPSQVGVLPLGAGPYNTGLSGGGAVPYAAEHKDFNIGINSAGTWLTFLERFDTQHLTLEDQIQFPTNNILTYVNGMRWGQDGLAYILTGGLGGSAPAQVFLIRGPFVLPTEGTSNSAPTLSSVSSGSVILGSGNQRITVTGSGFLPGASVVWNSVVHDTTFVDAQHLSVAVPAGEISAAATLSVTCRNPGSGDSNTVTVTVQ